MDLDLSMEKRKKKEHDLSVTAFRVVQEATGQIEPKSKPTFDFKALGRLGGLLGYSLYGFPFDQCNP